MITSVTGTVPFPVPPELAKPITLDQALQIAFRNSPDIRVALDQVERSRGVINEMDAHFNPVFSTFVSGTVQGPTASFTLPGSPPIQIVPPSTGSAGVSVLLPLDVSRRLAYASTIAQYGFQIQYLTMVSASEQVILNVKSAYYGLLRACGQRDVAQAAVDAAQARLVNTATEAESRHEAAVRCHDCTGRPG